MLKQRTEQEEKNYRKGIELITAARKLKGNNIITEQEYRAISQKISDKYAKITDCLR